MRYAAPKFRASFFEVIRPLGDVLSVARYWDYNSRMSSVFPLNFPRPAPCYVSADFRALDVVFAAARTELVTAALIRILRIQHCF